MKVCTKCGGEGPFPPDKRKKDGLSSWCRGCFTRKTTKWKKTHHGKARAWDKANPKSRGAQARYGLSVDEYKAMVVAQDGRCGCCGDLLEAGKRTHIDHSHTTGKVRAILCYGCNVGIAFFKENIQRLHLAIEYLQHHSTPTADV